MHQHDDIGWKQELSIIHIEVKIKEQGNSSGRELFSRKTYAMGWKLNPPGLIFKFFNE